MSQQEPTIPLPIRDDFIPTCAHCLQPLDPLHLRTVVIAMFQVAIFSCPACHRVINCQVLDIIRAPERSRIVTPTGRVQ